MATASDNNHINEWQRLIAGAVKSIASVKSKDRAASFCLAAASACLGHAFIEVRQAAGSDFSHAQHIFVPSSFIQRSADGNPDTSAGDTGTASYSTSGTGVTYPGTISPAATEAGTTYPGTVGAGATNAGAGVTYPGTISPAATEAGTANPGTANAGATNSNSYGTAPSNAYADTAAAVKPAVTTRSGRNNHKNNNPYGLIPPPPPLPAGSYGFGLIPPPPPSIIGDIAPNIINSSSPSYNPDARPKRQFKKTIIDTPRHEAGTGANKKAPLSLEALAKSARDNAENLMQHGYLGQAEQNLVAFLAVMPGVPILENELFKVHLARANYAMKIGDQEAAIVHAQAALEIVPDNKEAQLILSSADRATKKIAEEDVHLKKAEDLARQGKTSEAIAEYEAADKVKPSAAAHIGLGNLALKSDNKEEAKAQYEKALALEPESAPALRQLGLLEFQASDYLAANKHLGRALILAPGDKAAAIKLEELWAMQVKQNPNNANAHLGLARAFQLDGDLPAALAEYREVVRLNPQHPSLAAARASYKLALALQESSRCLAAAKTLASQGALVEAHDKAVEATRLAPSSIAAWLYKGSICERLGHYAEAHEAYMNVLRQDPKNIAAARSLSDMKRMPTIHGVPTPITAPQHVGNSSSNDNALEQSLVAHTDSLPLAPDAAPSLSAIDSNSPQASMPAAPGSSPATVAGDADVHSLTSFATGVRKLSMQERKRSQLKEKRLLAALGFNPSTESAAFAGVNDRIASALSAALAQLKIAVQPTPSATAGSGEIQDKDRSSTVDFASTFTATASIMPPAHILPAPSEKIAVAPRQEAAIRSSGTDAVEAKPANWAGFAAIATSTKPTSSGWSSAPQAVTSCINHQTVNKDRLDSKNHIKLYPVQLQLKTATVTQANVALKVILKNNSPQTVRLDSGLRALIRTPGQPDRLAPVSFNGKAIPANGQIIGTILIPGSKLDPSADLFIPQLLPASFKERDVHLTSAALGSLQ